MKVRIEIDVPNDSELQLALSDRARAPGTKTPIRRLLEGLLAADIAVIVDEWRAGRKDFPITEDERG